MTDATMEASYVSCASSVIICLFNLHVQVIVESASIVEATCRTV